jgi:hypothetical protein
MAGRQIRWQSVGRVAAIAAAVIAGIVSLPALLGSDKPPPVPSDVGLAPPSASAPAHASLSNPAPKGDRGGSGDFVRHIRKKSPRDRSSDRPKRRHVHPHARQRRPSESPAPPSLPVPAPPVYSYVPPPTPDQFGIER